MIVGIYGLQNKLKPERWNIGQSKDIHKRWRDYRLLRCKSQPKIYNALKKYGYDGFEKIIIEMCNPNIDQDSLNLKETMWIKYYNSVNRGYNLTGGGDGKGTYSTETRNKMKEKKSGMFIGKDNPFYGKNHSEETKKKISEIAKKRKLSEYTKNKIGKSNKGRTSPMKGKHHTNETKEKLRILSTGYKHTEESKRKISESKKYISEETRRKLGKFHIGKSYFLGRKHSEETKRKMSESGKNKSKETINRMKIAAKLRWEKRRMLSVV